MTQRAHAIELPGPFSRLQAFLREGAGDAHVRLVEKALGVAELASWLTGSADSAPARELSYAGHPFEVIPFAFKGGDALIYATLQHDAAIPPCFVSYAPGDDPPGPVWLADDAETALRHLLAVTLRVAGHALNEGPRPPEDDDPSIAVRRVAKALDIELGEAPAELDEAARSSRFVEPAAPPGWTFEPCNDEVGVLAPSDAFAPEPPASEDLATADDLLARGHAASALAVARNVYLATAHDADHGIDAARVMQRAYVVLGRDFLVRRVDAYVRAQQR